MNEQFGTFIVFFYVVIWIFTALNYEDEQENKLIVWGMTFFWPVLWLLKLVNK